MLSLYKLNKSVKLTSKYVNYTKRPLKLSLLQSVITNCIVVKHFSIIPVNNYIGNISKRNSDTLNKLNKFRSLRSNFSFNKKWSLEYFYKKYYFRNRQFFKLINKNKEIN